MINDKEYTELLHELLKLQKECDEYKKTIEQLNRDIFGMQQSVKNMFGKLDRLYQSR